jgi:hypothetical protein
MGNRVMSSDDWYEMLATADRPIRLFSNPLLARVWLDKMNGTD